ncbi:hypothetical protein KP07_02105 [Candidatus Liberibacter solanacearum]|nr:hypothetical protein KP07_02105 [Candidatus Liberibacter solanacearum]
MPTINAFNLLEQTTLREMKTKLLQCTDTHPPLCSDRNVWMFYADLYNDEFRIRKYDIKKKKRRIFFKKKRPYIKKMA